MDEKDFKRHLRDLVHGKHNPAEHDWSPDTIGVTAKKSRSRPRKTAKSAKRRTK